MEEIITPAEVAVLFKMHLKTVYKLAEKGIIPGKRVGRSWRFNRNEILETVCRKSNRNPHEGCASNPNSRP
jgi:excisionase family DNA binding protein